MKKIISFSLWGSKMMYCHGAIQNARIAKNIYPDFVCRFYVDALVPMPILLQLEDLGCEIVHMNCVGNNTGMFWRFNAVNEADIVLIRDADSRIGEREKKCVDEWLKSNKLFHSIHDHPFHDFTVMPGLMGFKKSDIDFNSLISSFSGGDYYGVDYNFFKSIYEKINKDLLIHDSFLNKGQQIPVKRSCLDFCGKVYDENENTVEQHEDAIIKFYNSKYKSVFIYHHMGLGDHIDCNALVRSYLKKYEKVFLFAKKKYSNMIDYMYRDEQNITIIPIDSSKYDDNYKKEYQTISDFVLRNNISNFIKIGHENYPWGNEKTLQKGCAELFYEQISLDPQSRFTNFYFLRDLEQEERVYLKLNPNNEPYIFVHDDDTRGYSIADEKIFNICGKEIKIIRNDLSENIFHFFKILENAEQIHLMESSFKSLVEILNMKKECFFHNFRKEAASSYLGNTKQKWKEIKC